MMLNSLSVVISRVPRLGLSLCTCCTYHFKSTKNYNLLNGITWKELRTNLPLNSVIKRCLYIEEVEDEKDAVSVNKKGRYNILRVLQNTPNFEQELDKHVQWTDLEWKSIRNNTLNNPTISESNVDAVIMDACISLKKPKAAVAYYKFLQNNYQLNLAVINKYLKTFSYIQPPLTKADEKEIINTYKTICKEYPCLDSITAETVAVSLCLTNKWKEAEKFLDSACVDHFSVKAYSMFTNTALSKGHFEIAWKYIEYMFQKQTFVSSMLLNYAQYLDEYEKSKKNKSEKLEKMFNLWQLHAFYPPDVIAKRYGDICKEIGWSVNSANISENGVCSCCKTQLIRPTLSDDEFRLLANTLIEKVVHNTDLFKNTSPLELKRFEDFIKNVKGYNIVIDGLNLFYSSKSNFKNTIQKCLSKKQKVLIIVRKHMLKDKNTLHFLARNTSFFITDNLTKDDIYILYATIAGGKDTYFMSNDLMRQHQFALNDDNLRLIFRKWQFMRQYTFKPTFIAQRDPIINKPFIYLPHTQKNGPRWHVASWDPPTRPTVDVFKNEVKWLCLNGT